MDIEETLLKDLLTGNYQVTPPELTPLAERITVVEGFYVTLTFRRQPKSKSDISPGRYDYERATSRKTNVGRWIEKRFSPLFPFLNVTVLTVRGRPLQADELVTSARSDMYHGDISCRYLRFRIESNKETPTEKNKDLMSINRHLASFPIFESRVITNDSHKLLFFKWHTNELEVDTMTMHLRSYEVEAIKELFTNLIGTLGYKVDCWSKYQDEDTPLKATFTSEQLNQLIPPRKQNFVKKTLNLN